MGATQPLPTSEPRLNERRGRTKRYCAPLRNTSMSDEAGEADGADGLKATEAMWTESSSWATTVTGDEWENWPLTLNSLRLSS